MTQLAATAVAMWISYLRGQRNVQLWTARSETRYERRRRVAAETAQRMQAMARALTTAADPAQVADAVFAALRDELHVDAATFALIGERGQLRTLRRFGYGPDEPIDGVLAALQPDGPVLGDNVALFAESLEDLRRQRPDISTRRSTRAGSAPWPSCPWSCPTTPSARSSCTGTTTARSRIPTRASSSPSPAPPPRPSSGPASPSTEFVNLERSQHLHQLSSALAAATTPGDVAHAAIAGGRRALGAQSAVVRVPASGERALSCLASSGHPALLSRGHGARGRQPCGFVLLRRPHDRGDDRRRRGGR